MYSIRREVFSTAFGGDNFAIKKRAISQYYTVILPWGCKPFEPLFGSKVCSFGLSLVCVEEAYNLGAWKRFSNSLAGLLEQADNFNKSKSCKSCGPTRPMSIERYGMNSLEDDGFMDVLEEYYVFVGLCVEGRSLRDQKCSAIETQRMNTSGRSLDLHDAVLELPDIRHLISVRATNKNNPV